jgi:Ca-activated chloride channel family protein
MSELRFLYPEFLWLLALLPLLLLYHGRVGVGPALRYSTVSIAGRLGDRAKLRPGAVRLLLRLGTLTLLVLALARPQLGNSTTDIEASGIDILLAVDVSGSMEAMDFNLDGKQATRLQAVQKVVDTFVGERPNDRIGLLAFGGRPYLVSPLTLDHNWLGKRLESLQIGMTEDGTAIGSAIGTGVNRLRDRKAKSKILILLTDGINNAGRIPPLAAAEAAQALGIKVYTIGAGTRGEAPVPVQDHFGHKRMVMARVDIDEQTLTKVAEITGGRYWRATDTRSLQEIYGEINAMETTTRTIKKFEMMWELFPFLLGGALLLLGIEIFQERKRLP